jgi:hypothetical protein
MQFLASLYLQEVAPELGIASTLLVFQCQNDPGMCDEWDADAGGNRALLVQNGSAIEMVVPAGPTTLSSATKVALKSSAGEPENERLDAYLSAVASDPEILGMAGGEPTWLQGEETPVCVCGQRMRFVAQIDSGASEEINFGDGGIGYSFICTECPAQARFLWQCL